MGSSTISGITYDDAFAVAASDTVNDPNGGSYGFAAFYVGVTGDVKVTTSNGNAVVFKAVPAGATIRLRIQRVWSTGTTATNVLGLVASP